METKVNEIMFTVGMKIIVPVPEEGDTWAGPLVTQIDDINDDGTIVFCDDDWNEHEIEASRVQLYQY